MSSWRPVKLGTAPRRWAGTAFFPTKHKPKGGSMKSKKCTSVVVMSLFAVLAMPVGMAAQDNPSQNPKPKHHQYKLIDLGTFGGPDSAVGGFGTFLNNPGTVVGGADTSIPDPRSEEH